MFDHPLLRRRFGGEGPEMTRLEWDIKGYFALGGAMHDSAVRTRLCVCLLLTRASLLRFPPEYVHFGG